MLYLASQSPRRRQLLDQLGLSYSVLDVQVPEAPHPAEAPEDYVRRVAHAKAAAGYEQVRARHDSVVLGADTEVVMDGRIFGKPAGPLEAREMLMALAGRSHSVLSAVAAVSAEGSADCLSVSEVRFADLSAADIDAYIDTGEPFGKAGAYAIQGHAARFISCLSGSYSGVMGLPLFETTLLLRGSGIGV